MLKYQFYAIMAMLFVINSNFAPEGAANFISFLAALFFACLAGWHFSSKDDNSKE